MKKNSRKKRYFLLQEALLGLAIIALLASFILKNPIYLLRYKLQIIEQMECERIADYTFSLLEEKLLEQLEKQWPTESFTVDLPPHYLDKKKIACSAKIDPLIKTKENRQICKLYCTLSLSSSKKCRHQYYYHIGAVKETPPENTDAH